MIFDFLYRKEYWLLVENNSEFLGPKHLAYGPFKSEMSAEMQMLDWQYYKGIIDCKGIVSKFPQGYIKQVIDAKKMG